MCKVDKLLVSIDFRSHKGGISRVANLIANSIAFDGVISLHGEDTSNSQIKYFNGNRVAFSIAFFKIVFLQKPSLIIFDHLNIARLLNFVPKFLLKKVVVFLHDEEAWIKVVGLRKKALVKSFRLLCNSEYTLKKFLSFNPDFNNKSRACVLGGIPDQFLNTLGNSSYSSEWFKDERPFLLFVSRLWKVQPYKGYNELLKAFCLHYSKNENALMRLAIVGRGDAEADLNSFIVEHKLENSIKIFNDVNDADLVRFYTTCKGLIFPSIREGFGLAFLEAMYFKKPCIGIVGQPAAEIIIHGKTGILIPNNEPETLKGVIENFEKDSIDFIQMGENGYVRFMNYFTNEHFKQRFLKALNE